MIAVLGVTSKVVVLTRTAPWTFTAGPEMSTGSFGVADPLVVDLDADGNLDIIVVSFEGVRILYGAVTARSRPCSRCPCRARTARPASPRAIILVRRCPHVPPVDRSRAGRRRPHGARRGPECRREERSRDLDVRRLLHAAGDGAAGDVRPINWNDGFRFEIGDFRGDGRTAGS